MTILETKMVSFLPRRHRVRKSGLVLAFYVIVGCLGANDENFKVEKLPPKFIFEKMGSVSVGLQKAHIVSKIDFTEMERIQEKLTEFVTKNLTSLMKNADIPSKKSYEHRVVVLQRNAKRAGMNIKSAKVGFTARMKNLEDDPSFRVFPRVRRSLVESIGMVTGVAFLGMSIYNYHEINEIREAQKDDHRAIERMVVKVDKLDVAVARNSGNLNLLQKQSIENVKLTLQNRHAAAVESILSSSEEAVDRWLASTHWWSSGVKQLLQGRLDPEMLDLKKLLEAAEDVEVLARKKDKVLVFKKVDALLNADFSWVFEKESNSITIILHLDIACQKKMQLYRLSKVPFLLNEQDLAVLSDRNGDSIAINDDGDVGRILSRREVDKCKKSGNQFACSNFGVVRKRIGDTCMGSALRGKMEFALRRCQIERLVNQTVRIIIEY